MIDTEGYVLMDYDGKTVTIEDGTMYCWDADDGQHWNSETLQFEDDDDEEDDNCDDEPDRDAIPYGARKSVSSRQQRPRTLRHGPV